MILNPKGDRLVLILKQQNQGGSVLEVIGKEENINDALSKVIALEKQYPQHLVFCLDISDIVHI